MSGVGGHPGTDLEMVEIFYTDINISQSSYHNSLHVTLHPGQLLLVSVQTPRQHDIFPLNLLSGGAVITYSSFFDYISFC